MFIFTLPIYPSVKIRVKDVYKEQCNRASMQLTHLEPHARAQDKNRRAGYSVEAGSRSVLN